MPITGTIGDYTISDDETIYIIPDIIVFDKDDDDYGYIILSQITTGNIQMSINLEYNIYNHSEYHLSPSGYLTDRSLVEIVGREPFSFSFSIKTTDLDILKILNIAYINGYECELLEIHDKNNKKIYDIGGTNITFGSFIVSSLNIIEEAGKKGLYIVKFKLTEAT